MLQICVDLFRLNNALISFHRMTVRHAQSVVRSYLFVDFGGIAAILLHLHQIVW